MAFNPNTTLTVIRSMLKTQVQIKHVQIGEPKSPPATVTAAVFMSGMRTPEVTLAGTVRVYDVIVRLYRSFLDDGGQTEVDVANAVGEAMEDIEGDFDLGATIRNVDVAGQYGRGLEAEWGYLEVGGRMFRTCDITVPLIVDAESTLVA